MHSYRPYNVYRDNFDYAARNLAIVRETTRREKALLFYRIITFRNRLKDNNKFFTLRKVQAQSSLCARQVTRDL